ncbi:hypothetical protein DUI87_01138 [Hirundo rustica rustica]|uniref:Retroviral nucleocapsid Gag protein p24 C-terminal domain-containing protein n=1 Tax=Hirundo rustica rustica TaxID=333673 RepID=A0A3M0L5E4_HIRRU|nr:hypothetical protein DUI87_01138 [Hirundo rustica rustica]
MKLIRVIPECCDKCLSTCLEFRLKIEGCALRGYDIDFNITQVCTEYHKNQTKITPPLARKAVITKMPAIPEVEEQITPVVTKIGPYAIKKTGVQKLIVNPKWSLKRVEMGVQNLDFGNLHGKELRDLLPELWQNPEMAVDNNNLPIQLEHLCGDGEWVSALKQAQEIPLAVLEHIKDAASKAFFSIQPAGPFQPYSKIKQLPSELFIKFVEQLTRAIELQVKKEEAQEQVLEEIALANANEQCKASNPQPAHGTGSNLR